MKRDKHIMKFFSKNFVIPYTGSHEGMVMDKWFCNYILEYYDKLDPVKNSTFRNYVMEEVFIFGLIFSKFINKNTQYSFCCRMNHQLGYTHLTVKDAYEKALNDERFFSIKPIRRDINDPLRILIKSTIHK